MSAPTIAFQGERGAYGELAVRQFLPPARPVPRPDFESVFEAVKSGEVDYGAVPVENSLAGSINESYDLLTRYDLSVAGETEVWVRHCLLALPGQTIEDIRTVYSHPQAIAQSMDFLKARGLECIAVYDTAGSAKMIREKGMTGVAAIASEAAASLYGLEVLARDIQSRSHNYTKFYLITGERELPPELRRDGEKKTSLVMATPDEPGSLYRCLGALAERGINLTKLESRPRRDVPWQYLFYVECLGARNKEPLRSALEELGKRAAWYKVLGSFPRF